MCKIGLKTDVRIEKAPVRFILANSFRFKQITYFRNGAYKERGRVVWTVFLAGGVSSFDGCDFKNSTSDPDL